MLSLQEFSAILMQILIKEKKHLRQNLQISLKNIRLIAEVGVPLMSSANR